MKIFSILLLVAWSFYLTVDKYLYGGALFTTLCHYWIGKWKTWRRKRSAAHSAQKPAETAPPEPLSTDEIIPKKSYTTGLNQTQADREHRTDPPPSILADETPEVTPSPPALQPTTEAMEATDATDANTDDPPPPTGGMQADWDTEPIDPDNDYRGEDWDEEPGGVDGMDLCCLVNVCLNKQGTPEEIERARRAFRDVQGTVIEQMILHEMNGDDGITAKLLDVYLKEPASGPVTTHTERSAEEFRLDDYV